MSKHRRITSIKDIERLNEGLYAQFGELISDRNTYEAAVTRYMAQTPTYEQKESLLPKAFKAYVRKYPGVSSEGAVKLDFETKKYIHPKRVLREHLKYQGFVKKQRVFARIEKIRIHGKEIEKFRDKKGRFVKVSRK